VLRVALIAYSLSPEFVGAERPNDGSHLPSGEKNRKP
jgi:hypothetical protein